MTSLFRVIFSTVQVTSARKRRPGGDGGEDEEEERRGPDPDSFAEGERPSPQHAVKSTERSLVEERQERPDGCEHGHHLVQLVFEDQKRGNLFQLAILHDERADTR